MLPPARAAHVRLAYTRYCHTLQAVSHISNRSCMRHTTPASIHSRRTSATTILDTRTNARVWYHRPPYSSCNLGPSWTCHTHSSSTNYAPASIYVERLAQQAMTIVKAPSFADTHTHQQSQPLLSQSVCLPVMQTPCMPVHVQQQCLCHAAVESTACLCMCVCVCVCHCQGKGQTNRKTEETQAVATQQATICDAGQR